MMGRSVAVSRPPAPRRSSVRAGDVGVVILVNGLVIVGMWVRHGGLAGLSTPGTISNATGQLMALVGTYLALVQLVLMARSPWLDQVFGLPRLAIWHRWVGFACLWLLVGHAIFTTVGYALIDGTSIANEVVSLLTKYPFVLMATAGLALLVLVAITSMRIALRRLSYETWYYLHLYAYLGIALGFAHQLVIGADFIDDRIATGYWIALYAITAALLVAFRFGPPIAMAFRHRMRVADVVAEAPGVVSIYVTGRELDRLPVRAGQFFLWRFLVGDGWWRPHPFSVSSAPNGKWLRLTVKDRGDDTRWLQGIAVGTPVLAEGPYGAFTGALRTRPRILLIAGGIGITPLRALIEELAPPPGSLTLIYRASRWDDVVFRTEIDALMKARGWKVHYVIGRRDQHEVASAPLDAAHLRALVPDVAKRDVFVSGPDSMIEAVRSALLQLKVPARQIHSERFSFR
jgi:predicted ferric reductase